MGERKFMRVEDAIKIVLGLARENILEDRQIQDDGMEEDQKNQVIACDVIDDFFCNVVTEDRLVDLKEVLMKLGNILVMQHGFVPTFTNVRAHAGLQVLIQELSINPSTDSIAALTNFLNESEVARETLFDLGFNWSMPDGSRGEEGNHPQGPEATGREDRQAP